MSAIDTTGVLYRAFFDPPTDTTGVSLYINIPRTLDLE